MSDANPKERKILTKEEKEAKLLLEAEELYARVNSANLNSLKDRVGWILNHFPKARNSDITLQIKFWETFEEELINTNKSISFENLYEATRLTAITRMRAKIQNDYHLFLASEEVQKHRGTLDEETREWAVEEQPDYPTYSVFIDESGKTDQNLIIGSVWVIDHLAHLKIFNEMVELNKKYVSDSELHFQKINKNNLQKFMGALEIIKNNSASLSFKVISVERAGNKDIAGTLAKLTSYLLIDGIEYENKTGRAPLPRTLILTKDAEQPGPDKIFLKEVRSRLEQERDLKYKDKLYIDTFKSIDSKAHVFLQVADLFVSSVNRKLNVSSSGIHLLWNTS